jgi:hypothetical protein
MDDGMDDRLRFKRCFRVVQADHSVVAVFCERAVRLLQGEVLAAVVGLLDGRRSRPEIVQTAAASGHDPIAVHLTLVELTALGLIEPASDQPDEGSAYWGLLGTDAISATAALSRARVGVLDLGGGSRDLDEALRKIGLDVVSAPYTE